MGDSLERPLDLAPNQRVSRVSCRNKQSSARHQDGHDDVVTWCDGGAAVRQKPLMTSSEPGRMPGATVRSCLPQDRSHECGAHLQQSRRDVANFSIIAFKSASGARRAAKMATWLCSTSSRRQFGRDAGPMVIGRHATGGINYKRDPVRSAGNDQRGARAAGAARGCPRSGATGLGPRFRAHRIRRCPSARAGSIRRYAEAWRDEGLPEQRPIAWPS